MKDKRTDSIEAVQEKNEQPSLPSIYSIAAAHSLSKDLKQKSLHLIKVKRRHGDYGQFDLTHAWSPEDLMDDLGSRYGSGRSRDSTLADESLTLARPFVMEPLRTFQVVDWDMILFCFIFLEFWLHISQFCYLKYSLSIRPWLLDEKSKAARKSINNWQILPGPICSTRWIALSDG